MKIDLPISGKDMRVIEVVEAEIVDVAPHLPLCTWAVHSRLVYAPWVFAQWTVTNIETGCGSDSWAATTKAGAIMNATRNLRNITPRIVALRFSELGKLILGSTA